MKKIFLIFSLILVAVVIGLSYSAPPAGTQVNNDMALGRMLNNGVLYPNPARYHILFDDFNSFTGDATGALWDTTSVVVDAGASAVVSDSLTGGLLKITFPVAASKGPNNGMNIQPNYAPLKLLGSPGNPDSATVPLEFECRFMLNTITEPYLYAGLTIDDASLVTGNAKGLFFVKHDCTQSGAVATTAVLWAKEINANTSAMDSASCGVITGRTWYRLKIIWNGAKARYFVNDVLKATLSTTANQPVGVNLKPTFEVAQGDSVVNYAYLDYIKVSQRR